MNKLITAVVVAIAVSATTVPAKADMTAVVIGSVFLMGRASTQPTPDNLKDSCTAQTVQAKDGNYSFISYEHCIKK